jgi:hypothetical protein
MNRYINICNDNATDELLSGIIMAIVAEFRLNGAALARVHMRGYEELVRMRGEIKQILLNAPEPLMLAGQIMPYIICEPDHSVYGPGGGGGEGLEVSVKDAMHAFGIDAYNQGFWAVLQDEQVCVLLSSRWLTPYLKLKKQGPAASGAYGDFAPSTFWEGLE